ncbi:hypothetical protein KCTC32516_00704 [Polaribacter huanghezhanensis]|uniref:DUF3078 domain-containing protein n=1 Tax=Polaribacter huanghezhanensis TaxID=1354726 RepID=UPI0026496D2C|nr:DUF3078 domain-containing protein [Polaribacter huanghezhanensis]WKD85364.1 hypothetical protein KCTC32516_00704 [Polaribacter huanghezhanensis]
MIKKICFALLVVAAIQTQAQDTTDQPISNWKKTGNISFLVNQSAFSNWISGGDNTVSGNLGINYDFNYSKENTTWDNKIMLAYGLNNVKGNGTRKTDDTFEFNSLYGKKATGNWSYSFFLNFKTQFTNGYDYSSVPKVKTSAFLAPGYFSFGPGMLWKKSDNFKINLAPITSKITMVSDEFSGSYGIDLGENTRYEFGFNGSLNYKTILMENITMENILNVYANYLDKPQNMDLDYQLNFVMQINKYVSTNLNFHAIVDDNATSKIQFKEVFGLGVNYIF